MKSTKNSNLTDEKDSKQRESGTGVPTGDDTHPNKPAREKEPTVPNQQNQRDR